MLQRLQQVVLAFVLFISAVAIAHASQPLNHCEEATGYRVGFAPMDLLAVPERKEQLLRALTGALADIPADAEVCEFPFDIEAGPDHADLPANFSDPSLANAQLYRNELDLDLLLWSRGNAIIVTSRDPFTTQVNETAWQIAGLEEEQLWSVVALEVLSESLVSGRSDLSESAREVLADQLWPVITAEGVSSDTLFRAISVMGAIRYGIEPPSTSFGLTLRPSIQVMMAVLGNWPVGEMTSGKAQLAAAVGDHISLYADFSNPQFEPWATVGLGAYKLASEYWYPRWDEAGLAIVRSFERYADLASATGQTFDDLEAMQAGSEAYSRIQEKDWTPWFEARHPAGASLEEYVEFLERAARHEIEFGRMTGAERSFDRADDYMDLIDEMVGRRHRSQVIIAIEADQPHLRGDWFLFRGIHLESHRRLMQAIEMYGAYIQNQEKREDWPSVSHGYADIGLAYLEAYIIRGRERDAEAAAEALEEAISIGLRIEDQNALEYASGIQDRLQSVAGQPEDLTSSD